jgi:hypothetical protein
MANDDEVGFAELRKHDDGKRWGYWRGDGFRLLPKTPLLLAGLGPPPFSVVLPDGRTRHVVSEPDSTDGRKCATE